MRFLLSALVAASLCACDSPDISDNDPLEVTETDAAPGADAGNPADGGPIDDAGPVSDAMLSDGQLFCNRYVSVCGFGSGQRFTDEEDCLATYATLTPDRVTCVNDALDDPADCGAATGKPPCN